MDKSSLNKRARERVPTGRRGRPSKSMIAAAMERPFCAYLHKICLNNRLEGHKYCIDHIMNDKTAPYRQCTYVNSVTGKRCSRAAHKVDRRASPLCHYHRVLKLNQQLPQILGSDTNTDQPAGLLDDLAHHDREAQAAMPVSDIQLPHSTNTFWLQKQDGSAVPSPKLTRTLAKYCIQRQNESTQPIELPIMEEIAARHNNADSDTESVDNNMDVFKHAQVFTEEELTRTLRDKMMKLRRLYIEQYGHIQYILKEKRLKYIQAQRLEDELYGELYSYRNNRDSPDYAKLRAMLKYHKTFGPESLLQEQAKRRKQVRRPPASIHTSHPATAAPTPQPPTGASSSSTTLVVAAASTTTTTETTTNTASTTTLAPGSPAKTPLTIATTAPTTATISTTLTTTSQALNAPPATTASTPTTAQLNASTTSSTPTTICIFSRTPQGCDRPCIPLSPYCRQHILYDQKQVLFRPCAGGIPPCLAPVVSFTRKNRCWLHLEQ